MNFLIVFLLSVQPIANNLDQYSHLLQLRLGESFNNSTYFVSILFQVNLNCIDCKSVTKIGFRSEISMRYAILGFTWFRSQAYLISKGSIILVYSVYNFSRVR